MKNVTLTSSVVLALLLGAGNIMAAPDSVQDRDQDQTQTRDRLYDGSGTADQIRDQVRDRTRDQLHNEEGSGDMNRNTNRFEHRRMNSRDMGGNGSAGRR